VAFVLVVVLAGSMWLAITAPPAEAALHHQTTVSNLCAFPILVEFRHDGMGTIETANCPAFGNDMIGDLYKGGHMVKVIRTDTGSMFSERHVEVGDMHHTVKIHPNGDITLHP
jgi:hypothetical protein